MPSIHKRALAIGSVHYFLCLGIALLAVAAAYGSALSAAYHGEPSNAPVTLLIILQAPVALLSWLVTHFSADGKTRLPIPALVLLAMPSSLLYGYIIGFLWSRRPRQPDH